ncbi:PREDICTED: uncharacterized protein LOC108358203 [Rhagoletis zephyria]|uniref:uncharacterized protein LOC108358203 n=1 Tax=Rhagoletis zephyria TaxID=28612 RepID=UPI000811312C|nr:PREDICTED: uncharacterized protein LOC108358203 [Rhagoletis zephyria]
MRFDKQLILYIAFASLTVLLFRFRVSSCLSWHHSQTCQRIQEQNKENNYNLSAEISIIFWKMDSLALWNHTYHEERIERRHIRDNSNILSLGDKSFIQNFRLNKNAFLYVLDNIKAELKSPQRSTAIPEIVKVSTTLKFLAQGGYQQ